jgi:hypothetical protein
MKKFFLLPIVIVFLLMAFLPKNVFALDLNPSYLLLSRMQTNVTGVEMILLITPNRNFAAGSELTLSFPDIDDGDWCRQNDLNLDVTGVSSSTIDSGSWDIDLPLPGSITAKCYQGIGMDSSDRIVISSIGGLTGGVSYGVRIHSNPGLATGPTAGVNNLTVQLVRGVQVDSMTFGVNLMGTDSLQLNAFVNDDNFSTLQVLDATVEKGIWSRIRVRILDSQGNPIQGRAVVLGIDLPDLTNWEIEQPTLLTNVNGVTEGRVRGLVTGLVKITAKDETFSQDIILRAFGWLNVTAVPPITLQPLPMYSSGLSREINWTSLGPGYQYYIECSLSPTFNVIFKNSGWITGNNHTFTGLAYGNAYYYRGKVRNVANFESIYSNIVSSIQAEQPSGVIEVLDPTVEKGIWSNVRVTVTDSGGNPLPGRQIVLMIDRSDMTNWQIEQPPLTDANGVTQGRIRGFELGIVKVTAKDTTIPIEFIIDAHDWLQVINVPTITLNSLPMYSKGLTRNISWNLLVGSYEYLVEYSSDSNFSIVSGNSGWINSNNFTFGSLRHGQGYFYRGKVRNVAGIESAYSNVVSSIQDNEAPQINELDFKLVSVGGVEKIQGTFLVTDLSGVSSVLFKCKEGGGEYKSCGILSSSGNFHYITIEGSELRNFRRSDGGYRFSYCFEASDIVGNQGSLCNDKDFPLEKVVVLEPTKEETTATRLQTSPVVERVGQTVEDFVVYIQDLEVDTRRVSLTSVGLVSTVTPLTIFSFFANPGSFYYVGQVFVGLFGFFRRRRKVLPYGYVYDALSKEPVNRAIVRIYEGKKVVFSTVTNVYGVFFAALEEGEYTIKVTSTEYSFPSKLISGNTDYPLENIYKGEMFKVEKDSNVQYAIPLDPIDVNQANYAKVLLINRITRFMKEFQRGLLFLGFLIALFVYIRVPETFNFVILLLYLPLLTFNLALSYGTRKKEHFGIVKDEDGNLLNGLVLALREMEFEKIVTKRISNERGQYTLLVPGGIYRLEVLSPGYEIKNLQEKDLYFEAPLKKPLLIKKNLIVGKISK